MESKLNKVELTLYFSLWILANLFSLYKLFEAQSDMLEKNSALYYTIDDLKPGWRMISRLKDVSDIEWSSWKYFIQTFWFGLIVQFIISEFIRRKNISLLKYWYIISSMFFVTFNMGYRQLIVVMAQPIIFYTIIIFGGKKVSIWLTGLFLLISYNTMKYKYFFWYFLENGQLQDEQVFLILFTVAWIELRCISFCIDYVDKIDKYKNVENMACALPSAWEILINLCSYVLYLPLLYIGPMILYEDFEQSFHVTSDILMPRLKRFLWDVMLFQTYTLLLELAFHYIYFLAMQSNMEAVRNLPALALCGAGLWMGVEFHLKYVISYGTTSAFARLDHMEPPPTPRCIARIHVYSQMWRYFDVGLYKFLVKYIYKPSFATLIDNFVLSKMMYKLLASFATFLFIFMWHGTALNILIWSVLNYLGILLELIGKELSGTSNYKWFKQNVLKTDEMEIRFTALLCTPLLALSAISNFYLFAGTKVGNLFFENFAHPTFCNFTVISLALYSCCHVSMALKDISPRTDRKNIAVNMKLIQ
ncbi:protein-cysteine N-palmitoyltransferase Rasp [Plodia interpunctella]|uniref:protein-cysteine N-palmitoyltransferase Rasp n=1 Tax=Plodia interpunctella TaxID=58824 RepID=UPI002368DB27|nr:protein-cysteine N-palmitoyltransferase Rasp [Plodia interpunctella]